MDIRKSAKRLAKLLAYMLGRQPDEFGLVLDADGYVPVKALLKAVCEEDGWRHVRRRNLDDIRLTMTDPPVEITDDRIRAVRREHLPTPGPLPEPPKLLYCCVRRRAYAHVREKGLTPSRGQFVHLAAAPEMALRLGRRSDREPVLVTVHTTAARRETVLFQSYGRHLVLSGAIPASCLTGPPLPKVAPVDVKPKPPPSPPTPGSFPLDLGPKPASDRERRRRKKEIAWKKDRKRRSRR